MAASPHETCEILLNQVKNSKLNFILSETPYSVNICLKKRFVKEFPHQSYHSEISSLPYTTCDRNLVEENTNLKAHVESLLEEKASERHLIKILEEKVAKAEAEAYRHLKELKTSTDALEKEKTNNAVTKKVIEDLNKEITKNKN